MTSATDLREKFDHEGKRWARDAVLRFSYRIVPALGTYGDLWGGGLSADLLRRERPDIVVRSAENNRELWPDLEIHAAEAGFEAVFGDFSGIGPVDLLFLDLCRNASQSAMDDVARATRLVGPNGGLVVTITSDHETDRAVSVNRPITVAPLLAVTAGMCVVGVMRYRNRENKWVVVTFLHGPLVEINVAAINRQVEGRDFYAKQGWAEMFGMRSHAMAETKRRKAAKERERLRGNPELRVSYNARKRAERRRRQQANPEIAAAEREANNARARARYANDPKYRERMKRNAREYRLRMGGREYDRRRAAAKAVAA